MKHTKNNAHLTIFVLVAALDPARYVPGIFVEDRMQIAKIEQKKG
jgi:hypothetical protein